MKHLITKVRSFLDKEYEVTLPLGRSKKQHYVKQRSDYVNPFKHQQELEEKRLQEARQKQIEAIKKLQHEQELKRMREALRKPEPVKQAPPPPTQPVARVVETVKVEPVKKTEPIQHIPKPETKPVDPTQLAYKEEQKTEAAASKQEEPKKSSSLDKKIEININFPQIKKPSIKKPHIKKPQVKLPTTVVKKSLGSAAKYKKHVALAGMVILGTAIIGTAIVRNQSQPKKDVKAITTKTEEPAPVDRKAKVIEAVSKRIELPKDEVPVLATVEDVEKLRSQDFFKDAQNGDKILMYRSNGKAFLYRPSTDEVLVQAPLVYQDEQELVASGSARSGNSIIQPEPQHGKTIIEPR